MPLMRSRGRPCRGTRGLSSQALRYQVSCNDNCQLLTILMNFHLISHSLITNYISLITNYISALSNWTVASNVTGKLEQFDRVRKLWNSPLDSHKEMCAVLAAITEVITAQVIEVIAAQVPKIVLPTFIFLESCCCRDNHLLLTFLFLHPHIQIVFDDSVPNQHI